MQTNSPPPPSSADDPPLVLLVEDVEWFRSELARTLHRECGIQSIEAEDALHAIRLLERHPEICMVVADERFPSGPTGTALLDTVGRRWPGTRRMLLSAWTTAADVERGVREGYEVRDKALPWSALAKLICRLAKAA